MVIQERMQTAEKKHLGIREGLIMLDQTQSDVRLQRAIREFPWQSEDPSAYGGVAGTSGNIPKPGEMRVVSKNPVTLKPGIESTVSR